MSDRVRFTTTLDKDIVGRFRKACRYRGVSMGAVFDSLMEGYMNSDTHEGGGMHIENAPLVRALSNPLVAQLVREVILPEIEARLGELKGALSMSKKTPE